MGSDSDSGVAGQAKRSKLPSLNELPKHFPGCCMSLSNLILGQIAQILPHRSKFILSIGCGSGLLEALLLQYDPGLAINGVEVYSDPPVNRYLMSKDVTAVGGTWDVTDLAASAAAWMFVYPREPRLVDRYLQTHGGSKDVEMVIWVGPRADWADFETPFLRSALNQIEIHADVMLAPYEMVIVARKSRIHL
ncbi:hypothetical protein AOQ84DRAFT_211968 [Glonium stellatum]|uniref:Uncharacterized protein n=1 Tax=Glonium stellatum TaxID=574774 RepID=A0A8E2JV14_9PEZI|nr:hypothetical protein AOQ84DRAFT_211968 [Glonium stellatum]